MPRRRPSRHSVRACSSLATHKVPGPATPYSEDELLLRETVAKFARHHIAPRVSAMDRAGELDPQVLRALFDQGLMGIETPEELGGSGMSFTQACIVVEEIAKVDPAVSVVVDIHNTLLNTAVRKYGSEAQRQRWLPQLAQRSLGAFALSEAESGSDAFALKTVATRHPNVASGEVYRLRGTKMWISNAIEAEWMLVFANADPAAGYRGITALVIDDLSRARQSGQVRISKKEDKLGIRASSCCEVVLEECEVPAATHVLGAPGTGYRIAIELLNEGRIGIGAQMVGLAQGALNATLPYLQARRQFGRSIADFQGVQFQVAQAVAELEAARTLVYHAARMNDQLQEAPENAAAAVKDQRHLAYLAACAKLLASQVACRVSRQCVEWMGGVGFTRDFPQEKYYRDAVIGKIYEGTENIQLQTIFKHVAAVANAGAAHTGGAATPHTTAAAAQSSA